MDRKLAATFLLSFCVVLLTTSVIFAAQRPYVPMENRAVIPVKWAPVYSFAGADDAQYDKGESIQQVPLGPGAITASGMSVGYTTYDYQHNGTMGRQVEHRGGAFVQMDWMHQNNKRLFSGRKTQYNLIDLAGNCQRDPGYDVHPDYGGYVGIDVDPTWLWAIPCMHSGYDSDHMAPRAYFDYRSGEIGPSAQFSYEDHPTDIYGGYGDPNWEPNATASEHQNLWPIVDWQSGGPDDYLHMVTCESGLPAGSPQTATYYRRTGPYGDSLDGGEIVATWTRQCVIDTVEDISPMVSSSPTTGQVVIAWTAPADFRRDQDAEFNGLGVQLCNDVWFARSTNYGQDWVDACEFPAEQTPNGTSIQSLVDLGIHLEVPPAYNVTWNEDGGNITNYSWTSDYKAYTNISVLIAQNEYVHIVWNGRRWTDTTGIYRRQSGAFHWTDDPVGNEGIANAGLIRTVAKALWDTGGTCYGHIWQSDIDKIGISECDDKFYVVWVQFGTLTDPCYDYETEDKFINGELYYSASDDAGSHWDRGVNLTETESHLCDCGDAGEGANCLSENWPSVARYGRAAYTCEGLGTTDVLDIVYVFDSCAGGVVQDGRGIWTQNDIMWMSTPCRDVFPEPAYSDDIGFGIGECFGNNPLVIDPETDTTISFTIENTGLEENLVTITKSAHADWLEITPPSFTVGTGVINYQEVELTFTAPEGAPDPSVYVCSLTINHDAVPKGVTDRIVPVCLLVCSEFARPRSAVLATPLKRLRVWNTGVMGGAGGENMAFDYIDECDTLHPNVNGNVYLYAASPIVARLDGLDTLRYTAYTGSYTDDDAMRPLGWATGTTRDSVVIDSITYPDFTYCKVEYATADTTIGFWSEYFVPKEAQYGEWMVVRQSFWNMLTASTDTLHDVLVGQFLDWDVPTDFRTDTVEVFDGPDYTTGNESGYEIFDSVQVGPGPTYDYWGALWIRGAEVNDSLEGDGVEYDYCETSLDHSTRYGAIIGDPHSPFVNYTILDNSTYVYPAGRTLWPGSIYKHMKNDLDFDSSLWVPVSGSVESTYVDLSMLVTFGEYDLPPGGSGGSSNPRKYTYTFAITSTPGGLSKGAREDLLQQCRDAITWAQGQEAIIMHCVDVPGDANNDGGVNIGDAVYLGNYVFRPGVCPFNPPIGCPPECLPEGDANCDGAVNIGDQVYINNYVFRPATSPAPCPTPPEKK